MNSSSTTTPLTDDILQQAAASLLDSTGLHVTVSNATPAQAEGYDALVAICDGEKNRHLAVEIKGQVNSNTLGSAIASISRIKKTGQHTALVTRHINPSQAERLRRLGIEFFDTAGNAFLVYKGLYVFVCGRKARTTKLPARTARAFNPTGSRLVFALLCQPGLEAKPYRDLARAAGISLGAVDWIMKDLKSLGYLTERGARSRHLVNRKQLLRRWVAAYPEQLRPKVLTGRYSPLADDNWWTKASLPADAFWGGEVGARLLTRYLKPQTVTIYSESSLPKFQAQHGLRRDPSGEIELLRRFWNFDEWDRKDLYVTPPLLVYADLIMTAIDRNLETAELIYDQYLTRLVE
ncbi:MAG TPA: type IV toxin-antitoxin system AbiEi family antitoxin [Pyrinomonadaceae bacterium]|nr:type IV toxin-antitoxin system AbiEi family antitoxin [Pyrinomonadaceae bacterium]